MYVKGSRIYDLIDIVLVVVFVYKLAKFQQFNIIY